MGLNDVLGWLYNMFGVDPVHDKFVINAVWPVRGQHGWQWRVVEVASTGSWRKFVSKVREKGYSLAIVVQKTKCVDRSGESSHAVVEETPLEGGQAENVWRTEQGRGEEVVEGNTQGEVIVRGTNREANDSDDEEPDSPMRVDAAEENEAVVDQMEVENEEYIALVVEGEDTTLWDNETYIPDNWTTISMSRMKVNDGLDAHWCYDSKQVKVGQMFHDKGHLQDAVKRWAFVQKREFRVKVSNRTTYDVKCIQGGCPWRVHGYKPQHDTLWVASRVEQHTCLLENTRLVHRNLTAAFVAQMVYSKVVRKTSLSPFTIMHDVEKEYGYEISYDKAWRAKQKALEMRFGTYEDSYHNLPPLLEVMQARNPGTHMAILDEVNEYGENVLRRAFWSFGCMIEAFKNCIPLLCVDGTFMTGKYRGTILTAIGVDADSHVVPVAFAFFESENTSSWLWFLRHIKMCVVENRPNVCVLHDRHAGLLSAIQKLQEDVTQSVPWPDLHSRWCMRHFGANFYRQFRSKRLMDLFKKLCKQNQQRKFDAIWEQLDRLTTTHMEEAEFVEHVHVESDTLLQRLEARPPVVRSDDVASVLRNFRARAAALLRRVSCRSAADVVQTSGRRPSPPLPRRSSVDRSGPSSSRRGYEAAHTSHGRPSFQHTPAPEYTRGSAGSGVPTSSTAPPRPQVFQTPPYVHPSQGASGSAHFPYMPTGDNVLNTPAWGLHITPRAPEQGHTQHTYDEYGSASTHHGVPAYSPCTAFIEDFFSTDPPQGEVGMDYWHAAPQVTQPTQETEAGQGPDVTPQQAARDRHPPDNLTYPTEQIRRMKKGGPSKRAKGTDRP
ncbi:uncharacterized protein [Oryza sativa Japonica Group]|uniref:uncharacterized protein n=1 Tax=Oryza sativa subsp. japonica TaxID=39947 RepID=UPI00339C2840